MLFLAVFCGFLAENQREHLIEHNRERQFMKSMVEDLKMDTTSIGRSLRYLDAYIPRCKNAIPLLFQENLSDSIIKKMYKLVPDPFRTTFSVYFQDRTTIQLKNSGNLRLIRKKNITDSLASYWSRIDRAEKIPLAWYRDLVIESEKIIGSVFNFSYYENYLSSSELKKNMNPKLISNDRAALIKLGNNLIIIQSLLSDRVSRILVITNNQATNLINLIEKEYHLE
jgi:hypothetical protein